MIWCLELNLRPLKEKYTFLTTEPPFYLKVTVLEMGASGLRYPHWVLKSRGDITTEAGLVVTEERTYKLRYEEVSMTHKTRFASKAPWKRHTSLDPF